MPHYEFFCKGCQKTFSKILTIARHDKEKITCTHCGSKNVEQCCLLSSYIEEERVKPA